MTMPLTPEDQKLLLDFAGPLFAESKEIDSMYFNDMKTKVDGMVDTGIARGIQSTLERDFALAQAQRRAAQQQASPPPPPAYVPPVPAYIPEYIPEQIPQQSIPIQQAPANMNLEDIKVILERQALALEKLNDIFENFVKLLSKNAES